MSRERYLVSSYGGNPEGTRVGLAKFFELCLSHGSGVIVVPTIGNVSGTMFTQVLPNALAKTLISKRVISIGDGKTITLCGSSTLKNFTKGNVYLTLWGQAGTIEKIESDCYSCTAEVFVTWLPEDSKEWARTYKVTKIYDDGVTSTPNF
ncbi:hypothetical protein [Pseudomonas sp. GM25]|uniref:hypothetical protein n=1 Tax=Pseudomonas sp. GM25 TaxID=1144327 RepID=UPI0002700501|nr:hypothetical protein [Pseudomonas sp. GM25]EJM26376.1 hypothetical protein PMI24_03767 [Pseudomonas sp. GM25]